MDVRLSVDGSGPAKQPVDGLPYALALRYYPQCGAACYGTGCMGEAHR